MATICLEARVFLQKLLDSHIDKLFICRCLVTHMPCQSFAKYLFTNHKKAIYIYIIQ